MQTGYRNPSTVYVVIGLALVTIGWAVAARSAPGVTAAVLFAACLWLLAVRPRLWLDVEGARVRNLGTRTIAWADVKSVGVEGRWGRWLTFHLGDDRKMRAWAVGWGGGGLLTSGWRLGRDYVRGVEMTALNLWHGSSSAP